VVAVALLAVAYYGSYLPLRKAQMFIATLQSLQTSPATSLQDLEGRLSIPLESASPIGQEELVRNTANSVLNFVQQSPDTTSTVALVNFLMHYYDPILTRGTGMSFGQNLYLVGAIHEVAFAKTHVSQFMATAQKYYEEGHALGPNRPQPLYGLFDVYRAAGNVPSTTMVADTILKNWPTDGGIRQAMSQFLGNALISQTSTLCKRVPVKK
jgi:hypothetical protein